MLHRLAAAKCAKNSGHYPSGQTDSLIAALVNVKNTVG